MTEKCFYGIKLYGILWNKVYAVNYILKFYFQQFTRTKGFNMKQNCFLLVFHFFLKIFYYLGFLPEHSLFTGQQGKEEGYLFNSSLPLPPT